MADADGKVPGDEALVALPGTDLKDLTTQDDLQDAFPVEPAPGKAKPFPSGKILGYVSLAVDKKFGESLTDEECDKLGLPHGSVMPDPDSFLPEVQQLPSPLVRGTPQNPGTAEVPPFTLDPEAELPGEEDIDHKGSTPAHHTESSEPEPPEGPRPTRTIDEVADEAKALMDAMVDRGFSRAEALELVKAVVKVRAKE